MFAKRDRPWEAVYSQFPVPNSLFPLIPSLPCSLFPIKRLKDQDPCFCELAALSALDILDEQERSRLAEYTAEFPELEAELAEFQAAVAAIPYSAPIVPMAANLKERLFAQISTEVGDRSLPPAVKLDPSAFILRSDQMRWRSHPVVPKVEICHLYLDRQRRELVGILRAEPGVTYPPHRHAGVEEMFMLEGDLSIDGQIYGKGDYIRSLPGSIHHPHTVGGCMFFFRTSLDDEIL